ncbi:MAG: 50S ribosomal protein L17 [Anaerolineaceae bacterium]|jgi:large subunit ribosomal protein L17|nr:50S ribosomal protein L17 [Anaerolineaceae bacterium]
MRHRVYGKRLSRSKDQRTALRRTMIRQLFNNERIQTTKAKAISIRGEAERLITLARNSADGSDVDKMNARRLAAKKLGGAPEEVKKLFEEIGPRYADRNGGYTRMFKLGPRQGDSADMVVLELVEE